MDNQAKPGAVAAQVPMLIAGEWVLGDQRYEDRDPYRGDLVATAPESSRAEVDRAIAAAVEAKSVMAAMPGFERARMLRKVGQLLDERVEDIAGIMAREMGKAITDARAEVSRSQDTISLSAEEAIRIQGEHVPLDGSAMGAGKIAFLLRFPVGVVGGITPFNAPFNLACHKVGPALAAGNSVVLKVPPQTPLVVHKMVELFVDAGVPKGALNVVYGSEAGPMLVRDPRVDVISFTGSS
ncbi:MAG: aldehyde dehydrogenase family protein, partial [Burkholderiales bacterium]|nr:aldehyde dehydrogenase family protein [Burkholderiales bacterium]